MNAHAFRRDHLIRPVFTWARKALPTMSDTEREALEAGDVWWDGKLFTGNPDGSKLLETPVAVLTPDEATFLNGPADRICRMLEDWRINRELRDLPPEVWDFLKAHRFFGMINPKEYGGLGFSAFAHSEVIRKLSSRSIACVVTVMVSNSLGLEEYCRSAQAAAGTIFRYFLLVRLLASSRLLPAMHGRGHRFPNAF